MIYTQYKTYLLRDIRTFENFLADDAITVGKKGHRRRQHN